MREASPQQQKLLRAWLQCSLASERPAQATARASAQEIAAQRVGLQADPAAQFALAARLVMPNMGSLHVAAEVACSCQRSAAWPEHGLVVRTAPLPAAEAETSQEIPSEAMQSIMSKLQQAKAMLISAIPCVVGQLRRLAEGACHMKHSATA